MGLLKKIPLIPALFNSQAKAKAIIRRLMRENPGCTILLFDYPWIGDVAMCCTYLPALMAKHPQRNYAIATMKKTLPIISAYVDPGRVRILELTEEERACLEMFIPNRFVGNLWLLGHIRRGNILVMNCWFLYFFRKNPAARALERRRTVCLGLPKEEETPLTYPKVSEIYAHSVVFEEDSPFVILNPYSNSMHLPPELFAAIAALCQRQGFRVFTNAVGQQETIPGTRRLDVPVNELFYVARYAASVLSIRSGILDYIIPNSSRMFVVYDKAQGYYPFWSLAPWRCSCDLTETEYTGDAQSILQQIEAHLAEAKKP